jgi:mannose-6-phosphate isomerase-like protein (cupin superfamily)
LFAGPRYGAAVDDPILLSPGDGEAIGERLRIKAARPEVVVTESRYEPRGRGPNPHVHREHVDAFWILEGRLAFALGPDGDEVEAGAGSFALVPPNVVHTFRNPGAEHARFLNFHAPGMGFETYLRSGYKIPYDQWDPPPDGGRSPGEVILLAPDEGERRELGAVEASIKAGGRDALGSLAVLDVVVGPGSAGPTLQREVVDSFYVLEGMLTLELDGRTVEAPPGGYGFVPPGNDHAFSNPGDEPVRMLNVMAPGGLEHDFPAV